MKEVPGGRCWGCDEVEGEGGVWDGHIKTHGHVKIMMDSGGGGGRRCPFSRGEGGAAERDAVLQDEAGRQQGSESR